MPALIPKVERELLLTSGTIPGIWILFTNGASNAKGSRLSIVLKPPTGNVIRKSIRIVKLTNNKAEYEAVIAGLELAKTLGAEVIEDKCESLLVVNQVNEMFEVKEERMRRYLDKLKASLHQF
uniref:RNase H type-1 domain-containing protein n=1 Tax=Nicotiana tabacum TaxID=4097 RepID=A0A1S3ZSD2_TOBAC